MIHSFDAGKTYIGHVSIRLAHSHESSHEDGFKCRIGPLLATPALPHSLGRMTIRVSSKLKAVPRGLWQDF